MELGLFSAEKPAGGRAAYKYPGQREKLFVLADAAGTSTNGH